MQYGEYRNRLNGLGISYSDFENMENDNDEAVYYEGNDIEILLNLVESDINDILNRLEDITGLSEIEEAKTALHILSCKLY